MASRVKPGDWVEVLVHAADTTVAATVVQVEDHEFWPLQRFVAWTNEFGGLLLTLPIVNGSWTLLSRPRDPSEAEDRLAAAKARLARSMTGGDA